MARGTRRHRLRPRKQWIKIQKFKETARLDGRLPGNVRDKGKANRQATGPAKSSTSDGRSKRPPLAEAVEKTGARSPNTVTARRKKPASQRQKKTRLDGRQIERLVRTNPVKAREIALLVGRTPASTEQKKTKWRVRSAHDRAIADAYLSGEISYAVALKRIKQR